MSRTPNFSPLARLYRWMEYLTFGPSLQLTRTAFLHRLAHSRRALVLGDGDGRFTACLLRTNPTIHIDAVDASSAMLAALTRRAAPHSARVRTHRADIRTWQPPTATQPYDLVATHFFLDCLTTPEVVSLAQALRPALSPSALWVVSEFAIPSGLPARLLARPLVSALYMAFALLTGLAVRTLPDHPSALRAAGFTLRNRRPRLAGLLISELWSAGDPNAASPPSPAQQ